MRGSWLAALASADNLFSRHHELQPLTGSPEPVYNIHLDFDYTIPREPTHHNSTVWPLRVGAHDFLCHDPETLPISPIMAEAWHNERKNWYTLSKMKASGLFGQCLWFKEQQDWSVSICVGREIVRYKGPRILTGPGTAHFQHLGYHDFSKDELREDGSVLQHYTNGYEGASSTIELVCGAEPFRLEQALLAPPDQVSDGTTNSLKISSFAYCDWRKRKERDLAQLISPAFGLCATYATRFWSYEFCHPDSLLQYHPERDGSVKDAMFVLGANYPLKPIPDAANSSYAEPMPMWPSKRAEKTLLAQPQLWLNADAAESSPAQTVLEFWTHLDLQIAVIPPLLLGGNFGMGFWPREAGALGIEMYMNPGTRCPSHAAGYRRTRVYYFCPSEMSNAASFRVVNVLETRQCEYDVLVEMASVCAHPLLKPKQPDLLKSVPCRKTHNVLTDQGPSGVVDELGFNEEASALFEQLMAREETEASEEADDALRLQLMRAFNWLPAATEPEAATLAEQCDVDRESFDLDLYGLQNDDVDFVEYAPELLNVGLTVNRGAFEVGSRVESIVSAKRGYVISRHPSQAISASWLDLHARLWKRELDADTDWSRQPYYLVRLVSGGRRLF